MNGITLRADYGPYIVTAISPTQHFYTDTGLSSAVTLPAVITATTTWYCAPWYSGFYTFTCTQLDGSDISPGVPQWVDTTADSTLNPRPSWPQMAVDLSAARHGHLTTGYYYPAVGRISLGTSAVLGNGTLRYMPWVVPNDVTVTRIGARVTTIGEAGSKVRLGIYNDNGQGAPGTLLLDAGQIAGDSATVQELTVSQALTAGVWWLAAVVQAAATTQPTLRISQDPPAFIVPIGTSAPGTGGTANCLYESGVSGALPSAAGTLAGTASAPCIHVKV